jgi:hypothetical protein
MDPKNVLYAAESNPFEAYRQIYNAVQRYNEALKELGGCKAFVTPLSSKLLSVGALLACYEVRRNGGTIGIPFMEARRYRITDSIDREQPQVDLCAMWISGECYAQ